MEQEQMIREGSVYALLRTITALHLCNRSTERHRARWAGFTRLRHKKIGVPATGPSCPAQGRGGPDGDTIAPWEYFLFLYFSETRLRIFCPFCGSGTTLQSRFRLSTNRSMSEMAMLQQLSIRYVLQADRVVS